MLLSGICGGSLYSTSSPAVLSSWNVSRQTVLPAAGIRCRWAIDAPLNDHVEINITTVHLPSSNTADCNTDHLELRDQPLV